MNQTQQTWSDVAHLYRRAGFGAGPDQLDAAATAGYQATVDQLLGGLGPAPDPAGDLVPLPALTSQARLGGAAAEQGTPAALAAAKARAAQVNAETGALQRWWLSRMLVSATPLREKLTLLWHGHFATAVSKVRDARLMYLQNQLLRTAGSGSFEDLTQAVAKGGAMMVWLDTATDKASHPNENFARELLELFTMGVGQYSQADVQAAARGFTGWVYNRVTDHWALQGRQHDRGVKTFLGHTGDLGGEDIIDIAVHQAASARFVVARVWSHLAYPVAPDNAVVSDLVAAYLPAMHIADLLRAVFLHPAFRSAAARSGLVKQPVEYLVGAARALHLDVDLHQVEPAGALTPAAPVTPAPAAVPAGAGAAVSLVSLATALGQTPFNPPNVGGWPQNSYWVNTGTALARLRAAQLLAVRADLSAIAAVTPGGRLDAVARLLGIDGWGRTSAAALGHLVAEPAALVALALNAPEYVLN